MAPEASILVCVCVLCFSCSLCLLLYSKKQVTHDSGEMWPNCYEQLGTLTNGYFIMKTRYVAPWYLTQWIETWSWVQECELSGRRSVIHLHEIRFAMGAHSKELWRFRFDIHVIYKTGKVVISLLNWLSFKIEKNTQSSARGSAQLCIPNKQAVCITTPKVESC